MSKTPQDDCIFCRIAAEDPSGRLLYEDERVVAFGDINPQAPVHILVIPRKHIVSLAEATEEDEGLLGHLLLVGAEMARKVGIAEDGFRTVINTGEVGGQTVFHIHVHILGGRPMRWPPG